MIRSNYSVLAWHENLADQHHRKTYAHGRAVPVIADLNNTPPFQLIAPASTTIESIKIVSYLDGTETEKLSSFQSAGLEVLASVSGVTGDLIRYPAKVRLSGDLFDKGWYYLVLMANGGQFTRYSEVFSMCPITTNLIKLSFCHASNLAYPGGVIAYQNYFENFIYFDSKLVKPSYEYEEQVDSREGNNFPLQQISYKLYRFQVPINEELLDILRLIRLHDFSTIEIGGTETDIDEIVINPEWLEFGDVARTEFEIKTDTIVVVNGRGVAVDSCEVPVGGCFDTAYTAESVIEFGSTGYNEFWYVDETTGDQVFLVGDDYIIRKQGSSFLLRKFNGTTYQYDSVTMVEGQIVYEANSGTYYEAGASNLLFTSTFVKDDALVSGNTITGSTIEVWVRFANGTELLIAVGTDEDYTGDGIGYMQPAGATSIQVRHFSTICGNYYTSDWVDFESICEFEIQGTYDSIEDAGLDGVQADEYFLLSETNNYFLPPYLVVQYDPSVTYDSDEEARAALGHDTCYAVSATNVHGIAVKGVIRALVLNATTYDDDADAATGGVYNPEIYVWNGGMTGYQNLFKQSQTEDNA